MWAILLFPSGWLTRYLVEDACLPEDAAYYASGSSMGEANGRGDVLKTETEMTDGEIASMESDFCFIDRNDPEWRSAWSRLTAIEAERGRNLNNPEDYLDGEHWECMDTEKEGDNWVHCFRIRIHSETGDRVYVRSPVTPGWEPNRAYFVRATGFAAQVEAMVQALVEGKIFNGGTAVSTASPILVADAVDGREMDPRTG